MDSFLSRRLLQRSASLIALCAFVSVSALAQSQTTKIGPIALDYHKFVYSGNVLDMSDGVQLTSANFDLKADHVVLQFAATKSKSASPIARATADGNTAKGTQVNGRFEQISEGRTVRMLGDHVIYTPDTSRPNGGRIEFTGNVTMTLSAPVALAEPSVTHLDHATVLLGTGPAYPRIEGGPGVTKLTPLQ